MFGDSNSSAGSSVDAASIISKRTSMRRKYKLPLPRDYFTVNLTKHEEQALIERGRQNWEKLVCSIEGAGDIEWIPSSKSGGVKIYQGVKRNSHRKIHCVKGTTLVHGPMQEAIDLQMTDTTQLYSQGIHQLSDDVLDAMVLYTLVPKVADRNHYVLIKWITVGSPVNVIKARDFLFVEYVDEFVDESGKVCWVKSISSIELAGVPSIESTHSIVRGRIIMSGYIYKKKNAASTSFEYTHTVHFDLNGSIPQWIVKAVSKIRVNNVRLLNTQLEQNRINKQALLNSNQLVPKSSRTACKVCKESFGFLKRKHNCQKCGDVICRPCCRSWKIFIPVYGKKKIRICTFCSVDLREQSTSEKPSEDSSFTLTDDALRLHQQNFGTMEAALSECTEETTPSSSTVDFNERFGRTDHSFEVEQKPRQSHQVGTAGDRFSFSKLVYRPSEATPATTPISRKSVKQRNSTRYYML